MRLHDVANAFNNLPMLDGYTSALLGNGQLEPWGENLRDGVMGERRTLSLDPIEMIPFRRVVACVGTRFILGKGSSDDWRGTIIRTGYVAHEATSLSQVRTLEEICLAQPGFTAWAGRLWLNNVSEASESSSLTPQISAYFASTEPIAPNLLITLDGRLNVVRSTDLSATGILVATCEQIAEPSVEMTTLESGEYDPISDTTAASPVVARVVRMRWQSLFVYSSGAAPKFEPGDIQLAFAKVAANVSPGATLTLSDGRWRVESVVDEGSVWLCRATRYA